MRRVYSRISAIAPPPSPTARPGGRLATACRLASRLALSLSALAAAASKGGPGIAMHARSVLLLARAAARGPARDLPRAVDALTFPMNSVRYFEHDFAWRHSAGVLAGQRYLDASSPRLFPLCLISARSGLRANLINPDPRDLEATRALAASTGVADRCAFHERKIEDLDFPSGSFDLVTSISVIEHIPAPGDARALARLWSFVAPGGRLVVTVPVARDAVDEYLDVDEYGLVPRSEDGWSFGQHIYDSAGVRDTFVRVAGEPSAMEVFGERRAGTFVADRAAKISGRARTWREPLAVANDYARFPSIDALPGWGVAGLVFIRDA